jgi:uncharacterized membrane protein YfcA
VVQKYKYMADATTIATISAAVFVAAFLQSLSGFGFAILIMPLATLLLGLQTAAPLVALAALTTYAINLIRYHRAINYGELWRLGLAAALGVPIGVWLLTNANESFVKQVLGVLLIAYAIYSLANIETSRLVSRRWVYAAGFVAGCLGGAYNTPGPPAILYGSLRQWPKDEFRAVLQALFFVNGALVVSTHWLTHHLTIQVFALYLYAVPALALGILIGSLIDGKVNRNHFRILVTAMILGLGLSLLLKLS